MNSFTFKQVRHYYLDYDATNAYEVGAISAIAVLNMGVLFKILFNLKHIVAWYVQSQFQVDPYKLVCINFILLSITASTLFLTQLLVKLFLDFYCVFGCVMSGFLSFGPDSPVYFNIIVYKVSESVYVQLQNICLIVSTKFWLKVIQVKYGMEVFDNQKLLEESQFENKAHLEKLVLGHSPLPLRATQVFLSCCTLFIFVGTVLSNVFIGLENEYILDFTYILILFSTIISGGAFSLSCIVIYLNLESFYSIDQQYKRRVTPPRLTLLFQVSSGSWPSS